MSKKYKEYIRIASEGGDLVLEVCEVSWKGPHTPVSVWKRLSNYISPIDLEELDNETNKVLNNKKYFGYCKKCESHFISGHMHSKDCYQSCASEHFGVVY